MIMVVRRNALPRRFRWQLSSNLRRLERCLKRPKTYWRNPRLMIMIMTHPGMRLAGAILDGVSPVGIRAGAAAA